MAEEHAKMPDDDHKHHHHETADTVDKETTFTNYKSILSKQFAVSLVVESVGVMFFQILGATATKEMGPFVNGFALAVWIYTAANISGGHINPAVTFSVFICGFFPLIHSLFYVVLQIVGAIIGSWVTSALVPGAYVNMGDGGPGCFDRGVVSKIDDGQLFGWELVMTFTLISSVYACGIAKPGHGSHTPLVVGLSLLVCAGSGGQYTGAALNPARVLGPLAIFTCGKDVWWIYIVAHLAAALLACSLFAFVSGAGPLNPFHSTRVLGLRWHEAIWMMISGLPPKRLRVSDKDNIADLIKRETSDKPPTTSQTSMQQAPQGGHIGQSSAEEGSPRRRRPDPKDLGLPTSRSP